MGGSSNFLNTLGNLTAIFGDIVDTALPVVFGLAILAFFWGIFRYVFAHSQDDKLNGRNIMMWSLIAIFVMASLWGIVTLAQTTLGVSGNVQNFRVPHVQ